MYPAAWRKRYGGELEEVAEAAPEGWRTDFDLLTGAFRMRLKFQRAWRMVLGFVLAGALLGWLGSFLVAPQWEAGAVMQLTAARIRRGENVQPRLQEFLNQALLQVMSRRSLAAVILDPGLSLYRRERSTEPLEDVEAQMRKAISVRVRPAESPGPPALVFTLRFAYSDPVIAAKTVNVLIEHFLQASTQSGGAEKAFLDVLDPPLVPKRPLAPVRGAFAVAGVLAGLAVAALILVVRRPRGNPIPRMQPA
jgi:hypothetical protein